MIDDERQAAIDAECDIIRAALTRIALARNPECADDPPYIVGWIASVEWTNGDLERTDRAGTFMQAPPPQALSTSRVLAEFAADVCHIVHDQADS